MTGAIIEAISQEIKKLFEGTGVTVLRDTQFKIDDMPVYTAGLVILSIENSPDQYQAIGGTTCADWELVINAFFYDENSVLEVDQTYNTQAYDLIDTIKNYIALEQWQTTEMIAALNDYCFKLTLNGIAKATELTTQNGGMLPGYAINYNSIAFNQATQWTKDKTFTSKRIEGVTFVDYDDLINYNWLEDVVTFLVDVNTFNNLTTGNIGDRYYVQTVKKIYEILTLTPTSHKPATSIITTLVLNDVFVAADNNAFAWVWDGSNIVKKELITQYSV